MGAGATTLAVLSITSMRETIGAARTIQTIEEDVCRLLCGLLVPLIDLLESQSAF